MKYSELKKRNEQLQRENTTLKALQVSLISGREGEARQARFRAEIDPRRELIVGQKEYRTGLAMNAARTIADFLVSQQVIKPKVVVDQKTNQKFVDFDLRVLL